MIADKENVDRGVQLLDERLPGWRNAIDPDRLDLRYGCRCIIGQIFNDYETGLEVLGLSEEQAKTYGFYRERSVWSALTNAWRKVVAS